MKIKLLITISCLIIYHFSSAQTSETPVKVEVASEEVIKVTKPLTTLYVNTNNGVRITAPGHAQLRIEANNAKITQPEKGGVFIINPEKTGKLTVKIYEINADKNAKPLASNEYEVINLPDMRPWIAGKYSGNITKKALLADSMLHVGNGDMYAPNYYTIEGFKVSITQPGKSQIFDLQCPGSMIPIRVRNLIRASEPGTTITFDYFRGKGYSEAIGDEVRETLNAEMPVMQPMIFTIVNE